MNFRKQFTALMAAAALLIGFSASAADAQNIGRWVENLLGGGRGGGADATTLTNLHNTAATLDSMINTGLANGTIHPAQAQSFRAQLAQIVQTQNAYMGDGRLQGHEIQNLVAQFTSLTTQVNSATGAGSGFYGQPPYGGYPYGRRNFSSGPNWWY